MTCCPDEIIFEWRKGEEKDMSKSSILEIIDAMDPVEAANEMADAAKKLFSLLGPDALRDFLARLVGDEEQDKVVGLVHL
jgi:hypothetical protein